MARNRTTRVASKNTLTADVESLDSPLTRLRGLQKRVAAATDKVLAMRSAVSKRAVTLTDTLDDLEQDLRRLETET